MAIRKLIEITDVNRLGMYDFSLTMTDDIDYIAHIAGNRGYPHYYRVDLQFFDVEYIACAPFFDGTFRFRQATEQEVATLYKDYVGNLPRSVYCFEEDLSQWRPMP